MQPASTVSRMARSGPCRTRSRPCSRRLSDEPIIMRAGRHHEDAAGEPVEDDDVVRRVVHADVRVVVDRDRRLVEAVPDDRALDDAAPRVLDRRHPRIARVL